MLFRGILFMKSRLDIIFWHSLCKSANIYRIVTQITHGYNNRTVYCNHREGNRGSRAEDRLGGKAYCSDFPPQNIAKYYITYRRKKQCLKLSL